MQRRQYSSLALWAKNRKRDLSWFELDTDRDAEEAVIQLYPVLAVSETGPDDLDRASVHEAA